MAIQFKLYDNEEEKQYEFRIKDSTAKIEYIKTSKKIWLTHTEVSKNLEGKGVGTALVKQVLKQVKEEQLALIPLCPFVAAYIKRHEEWRSILDESVSL